MDSDAMQALVQRVNADARLVWRGRYVDTVFLLEAGDMPWIIRIGGGRVETVTPGPFAVMPAWRFALRAAAATWQEFRRPLPRPGFHDLMAMVKRRTLRVEGDLHPFMSNLQYFKDVLAMLREVRR